jgi:hypothetical protein
MNSKPENRVRTEDSMGPKGFKQISMLKMGSILEENNLILKAFYSLMLTNTITSV